jgi:hypothetical protein
MGSHLDIRRSVAQGLRGSARLAVSSRAGRRGTARRRRAARPCPSAVVDDVVWVAGAERQQRKPVVAGAERVCDARRRRACPFHARLEPARCSTHRPGRSSRALSDGHRIRCLPRRRAHLDGACRDNASCLRFSSEAILASSSSMVPRRAAPIACLRESHQPRARRSLRTKSGSPGADGRRSSSRRQAMAPAGAEREGVP